MGSQKVPYYDVLSKVAGAGSNDLESDQVETGRFYCIQSIAVENETTDYTKLRLLSAGTGGELPFAEQKDPLAATLYWFEDDVYLIEGMYIVARLTGCTANDVLKVYLRGYWTSVKDGSYA